MKATCIPLLVWMAGAVTALGQPMLPPATPPYYRIAYEPSTNVGELKLGVTYTLWVPPGAKRLRGVIVHQHGCGE